MIDLENYLVGELGLEKLISLNDKIKGLIAEKGPFKQEDRIGKGFWGEVFRLSDDYVVKVVWGMKDLSEECALNEFFYDNGVSVPKPYGLFGVNYEMNLKKGFVMEYVHGIDNFSGFRKFFAQERYKEEARLDKKHRLELVKCKELGYVARDNWLFKNSIYVPETDKIVLIDFDPRYWRKVGGKK